MKQKKSTESKNVLTSQQEEEDRPNSTTLQFTSTSVSSQPKRHIKNFCQRGLSTRKANGLPLTASRE